jgi:membrane-associated phospholipid phosphatase
MSRDEVKTAADGGAVRVEGPGAAAAPQTPAAEPARVVATAVGSEREGLGVRGVWAAVWPWLVVFVVACGWDRAVWLGVSRGGVARLEWLETAGTVRGMWAALKRGAAGEVLAGLPYRGVYEFGRMLVWTVLAAVVIFRSWAGTDPAVVTRGLRRGVWVFGVPAGAGLLAEGLKLVARRLRPEAADGWYVFKPAGDFWRSGGVGLASSHAAVAVGAALAVGAVWPRWRGVLWALAALTCVSRVGVGAHFLSDVVAGAALGVLAYRVGRRVAYPEGPTLGGAGVTAAVAPATV